jgi:hypothetical protein
MSLLQTSFFQPDFNSKEYLILSLEGNLPLRLCISFTFFLSQDLANSRRHQRSIEPFHLFAVVIQGAASVDVNLANQCKEE